MSTSNERILPTVVSVATSARGMRAVITLACVLALAPVAAQAQILIDYSGIRNVAIPSDFDGLYIDLDTATTSTSEMAGWDINLFFGGYAIANSAKFQPVRLGTAVDSPVLNLAEGTVIGPSGLYASAAAGSESHLGSGAGQFQSGTEGFLGFKFEPTGGGGPLFGWMRVSLTVNTSGAYVKDWAIETTGATIPAGLTAVPEPGETCVMAGLGLGVLAVARRMGRFRNKA